MYLTDTQLEIIANALEKEWKDYVAPTREEIDCYDSMEEGFKAQSRVGRYTQTTLIYQIIRSRIGKIREYKIQKGLIQ